MANKQPAKKAAASVRLMPAVMVTVAAVLGLKAVAMAEGVAETVSDAGHAQTTEAAPATPGAEVKPDYKVSVTGRSTSMANPDYDVRNVVLTAIVSSERLPALLDALSRVNFNTVLEVKLADVDVKSDLEKGFYYGNDHVVRATITLETV